MELGVHAPRHRNSRTAWPNSSAPSRQTSCTPPNTDRHVSKDVIDRYVPVDSATLPSRAEGTLCASPVSLCVALKKAKNRTSRPSGRVDGSATIAR